MALPSTGGTWAEVLEPGLNPLAERYWQITDVLIADYFRADGTVFNLADPSVGLGTSGLFTPFAADGISIRKDLLITSPGTNLGFYHIGLTKEDSVSVTPDQTMTSSASSQLVRPTRSVLTKLEDKIAFEPKESTPLVDYLLYELPLVNVPALGTPNYQVPRGNTDVSVERVIVLLGVDTGGNLLARVFPRVVTEKKAKTEFARKNPDSSMLTYQALPCPFAKAVEWKCRGGSQWLASGDFEFETFAPVATPVTGLKADIVFPTPIDIDSPTYTVHTQLTSNGALTLATVADSSGTVSSGFTTVQITDLTASTAYHAAQVTATGGDITATSPLSNSFTSTAS